MRQKKLPHTHTLSLSPIVGKRMQQIMSGFQSVQSTLLLLLLLQKAHEKIKWVFINTKNQLIIIIIMIIISSFKRTFRNQFIPAICSQPCTLAHHHNHPPLHGPTTTTTTTTSSSAFCFLNSEISCTCHDMLLLPSSPNQTNVLKLCSKHHPVGGKFVWPCL